MKVIKTIAVVLLIILILIQFYRPEKNKSETIPITDITIVTNMAPKVKNTLQNACYNCHSNNTVYPMYYNIEPVAYWMAGHINEGKRHLNFSEWGNYSDEKKSKKLEHIIHMVKEGKMPLDSYKWLHSEARLTQNQVDELTTWAKQYLAINSFTGEEQRPQ